MQLTVLGSNGTYPTAGRPASGYLVSEDGTRIWMDAGPGTYGALCLEMDPRDLDAVVLSHRHPDHCADIFALFHAMAYAERSFDAIPVIVPEGLADVLLEFVRPSADSMRAVFDFRTVAQGDALTVGPIDLSFAIAAHPPPTIATRVEAGGKAMMYTGDTGPSPALEEHASGVDLLLAEASMDGPRLESSFPHHMTGGDAGLMAARSGARRLVLTHIAPYVDPDKTVAEAESEFEGEVALAVPGTRITI